MKRLFLCSKNVNLRC